MADDGVLLIDKPAGKTSHDVVAAVRRGRGGKVGHAGTLDPFATGLLIGELGDAYCEALRRTAIGPFRVEDADPDRLVPLDAALGFLPGRSLEAADARRAGHGTAVPGEATGPIRLIDEAGLIAVAEPRADGTLKPVVGFRGQ